MIPNSRFRATKNKTLVTGTLFALVLLMLVAVGGQTAFAQSAGDGEAVFSQKCVACHTVGGGDGLGPDLEGVGSRRDAAWLNSWLTDPGKMLADKDPIAVEMRANFTLDMPDPNLTSTEIADLVAFFGPAAEAVPALISAGGDLAAGDATEGRKLFTGPSRFDEKGPACTACHSVGGIGALGGGSLGPDLTGTYARLGDAMITWPQNFPPMQAIYSERPLTPEEEADLLAFFRSASATKRSSEQVFELAGLAIAGAAIVALLSAIIWRRRLRAVRKPMISGTASGGTLGMLTIILGLAWAAVIGAGLSVIVVTVI